MSSPETAEGWVLQLGRTVKELSASEMHVLLTLAARHNRDYRGAWPKLERLQAETHISERQIVRVLNALEDKRIIGVEYGPLPAKAKDGRVIHGNTYRFIGFDVPDEWTGGRRRRLGGHPSAPVDMVSTHADDVVSTQLVDMVSGEQLPSDNGSVDIGDAGQLTSLNSPLRTRIGNPSSAEGKEPVLEPVARARANGTSRNGRPSSKSDDAKTLGYMRCLDCGAYKVADRDGLCQGCARASPSPNSAA